MIAAARMWLSFWKGTLGGACFNRLQTILVCAVVAVVICEGDFPSGQPVFVVGEPLEKSNPVAHFGSMSGRLIEYVVVFNPSPNVDERPPFHGGFEVLVFDVKRSEGEVSTRRQEDFSRRGEIWEPKVIPNWRVDNNETHARKGMRSPSSPAIGEFEGDQEPALIVQWGFAWLAYDGLDAIDERPLKFYQRLIGGFSGISGGLGRVGSSSGGPISDDSSNKPDATGYLGPKNLVSSSAGALYRGICAIPLSARVCGVLIWTWLATILVYVGFGLLLGRGRFYIARYMKQRWGWPFESGWLVGGAGIAGLFTSGWLSTVLSACR